MRIIIFFAVLFIIFALPSQGMLQFENCVNNDPFFSIELNPDTITRSVQSIPELNVNIETMVKITPNPDINIRRIDFGTVTNQNIRVKSIVDQQVLDNNYVLHISAEFADNTAKSSVVGGSIKVNGIAVRVMFQNDEGSLERTNLCLPEIDLKITGSTSDLPKKVDDRVKQVESKIDFAEKVKLILGVLNLMGSYSCNEKQTELTVKNSAFNENCLDITDELKNIVLGTDGYSVGEKCTETDSSNSLHPDNCNLCLNLYNEMNTLKPIVQNSCQRLQCHDMVSLEHFKSTYGGDVLGISFCDADNYDETKCIEQYLASEKPKCMFADPIELSVAAKNPATGFNPLGLIDNAFCADRRDPIKVIKSPSNDLFSSLTCGCLPGLMGWADLWHDSLKMELECVKGSTEADLSECRNALFVFSCDMFINSLTCGGLNFGPHSESARFLFNPEGESVDITGMTPQQIREHINNGFTTMLSGTASFDGSELIHDVCSSVFGDKDVDWADALMNAVDISDPGVVSLCPSGQVRGPCYCGSDLSDIDSITNNCGMAPNRVYCDFDDNPAGECVSSVSIPVPTPTVDLLDPPDDTVDSASDSSSESDNSDVFPPNTNANYYHRISSSEPVNVKDCLQGKNGVRIVVRTFQWPRIIDYNIQLDNRLDFSTNEGSTHNFFCLDSDYFKSDRGTKVVRIEHSKTGEQLPPEKQSQRDTSGKVPATQAQVELMAAGFSGKIHNFCTGDISIIQRAGISRLALFERTVKAIEEEVGRLAFCMGDFRQYPHCNVITTRSTSPYYDDANNKLTEYFEINLDTDEFNWVKSLPKPGENGFNEMFYEDVLLRACLYSLVRE